ncbi:Para-Rep C7 [Seminavis robusta]|uniref:Para-Rep C7 n=1 Tax=Seminavis robusta TaxID=568900 RepID=A0A9N8D9H7_9STRA|nr:Para-Rep C7 [Seminavis robusta]|eukprot:Sro45_g027230.1 Para-Rep C7 (363) ;mRNA; r:149464-150552
MPNGAKHWAFTCNNYTPADIESIEQAASGSTVDHVIFGKEVGASGTPHLQGNVSFSKRTSMKKALKTLGIQAHLSITRQLERAIEYCKKNGDWCEFGTPPRITQTPGKRSDIDPFKEAVKAGNRDKKLLRDEFSEVAARYPRFFHEFIEDCNTSTDPVEDHPLRPWQEDLNKRLSLPPNSREIIFVVDPMGNQGKSWFAQYYCSHHENTQIILPGKKADMAYAVDTSKNVFLFDCPRSKQGEFIQYDFLEELKNGLFFSTKYESRMKRMKKPHIVVFMNEPPDMTKLSKDRYAIYNITDSTGNFTFNTRTPYMFQPKEPSQTLVEKANHIFGSFPMEPRPTKKVPSSPNPCVEAWRQTRNSS